MYAFVLCQAVSRGEEMASSATCGITISVEESMNAGNLCGCAEDFDQDGRFFRGIMIAIPSGLLLWAGLLRIAGEVLHRM
jgi:hypothetical protein